MIGRVRIKEDPQTPMSHVDVYVVGHDWEAATSTNNTGHFELINVCPDDLEMRVDKQGRVSEQLSYNYNDFPDGDLVIYCAKNGQKSSIIRSSYT